jgi:hypothetical protein
LRTWACPTKKSKKTGVAQTTAKDIVRRARAHAAEHNLPLSAPENYEDDHTHQGRRRVLSDEQKTSIVNYVTANREHRSMTVTQLKQQPKIPPASEATIQNALYKKGYGRS